MEKASNDISLEQLQRFHSDEEVKDAVYDSPLQDLFLKLVDATHTDSQESMERMAELRTKPFAIKLKRHSLDNLVDSDAKPSDASSTAIYFANFPWYYLDRFRNKNVDSLKSIKKIPLHHSQLYNLFNTRSRTEFIKHMIALICMVAARAANVGHLRRRRWEGVDTSGNAKNEPVVQPASGGDGRERGIELERDSSPGLYGLVLLAQSAFELGVC
jgi:hypothetical protein